MVVHHFYCCWFCEYIYIYIHIYIFFFIVFIRSSLDICVCVCVCACVCACVCVCVCVCVFVHMYCFNLDESGAWNGEGYMAVVAQVVAKTRQLLQINCESN